MVGATTWRLVLAGILAGLAGTGIQPSLAQAHEFWLAPSVYDAHAGDTVRVLAFSGAGFRGESRRFARGRVVRLVASGVEPADLAGAGVDGDSVFASIALRDARGSLIAYESNAATIELPGPEFDAYLEQAGLDVPRALRRAEGARSDVQRERYARCAKTWVSGSASRRATAVTGLTLELVPLRDPSREGRLLLRVLFRGRPLPGGLVRAWRQPLGPGPILRGRALRDPVGALAEARSDEEGIVRLDAPEAGEWLVSCVHMVRSENPAESDWQSWWASLTFARPPVAGSRRRGLDRDGAIAPPSRP